MRIQALLLVLSLSQLHVVGQVVTINYKNAPLQTVLQDVAKQTGFSFHYGGQNLADGAINFNNGKPITLILADVEMVRALEFVFQEQPYSYSMAKEVKKVFIKDKEDVIKITPNIYTVRGRVTDEQGKPVEGATLSNKNGKITITDSSGRFNIDGLRENDSLLITHVSFVPRMERVKVRKAMDVQMFPVRNDLEEVIVHVVPNGYQKIPERKMTGSFAFVDSQQFNRRISTSFMARIANNATGVYFSRNQGGTSVVGEEVVVRGLSTIFGVKKPLVVIDNFPYDGDLNNINPNDIESVTILKDAVASGLYGATAGNGVIIVNTKKGGFDQTPRVSLVSNLTVGAKPDLYYLPSMSTSNYMEVQQFLYDRGFYNTRIAIPHALVPPDVMILDSLKKNLLTADQASLKLDSMRSNDIRADLEKYIYQKVINQQYALNINGGGNKVRYYFSAGYDRNQTNLVRNHYERITLNANNTYLLMKDKLELNAGVAFAQSTTAENNSGTSNNQYAYPYTRLVNDDGSPAIVQANYRQGYKNTAGGGKLLNWDYVPIEELRLSDNQTKLTDYRVNVGAEYKLLQGLKVIGKYQFGRGISDQESFRSQETYFTRNLVNTYSRIDMNGDVHRPIPVGGIMDKNAYDYTSHNARLQVDYNVKINTIHNFSILSGVERRSLRTQREIYRYYGYDRSNQSRANVDLITPLPLFATPFDPAKIPDPAYNLGTIDKYISYYTNLMYTLKYRYNFSFNARRDKSNLFGQEINQSGTPLWSIGAGWLISSEKFFDIRWLSELRMRVSHGYTGNMDKTISPYTIIQYGNLNSYNAIQAFVSNPANRNLQWEKIKITNAALDFSIRNYRISGTIEFYLKESKDLIGYRPIDHTYGVPAFKGNSASMRGKGLDITINARFIDKRIFKWYGTFLHSFVTNKVTSYPDAGKVVYAYVSQIQSNPLNGTPLESIYAFEWAGLNPGNGNPRGVYNKQVTEEYDKIFNSTDLTNMVYVGPSTPRYFGSYRNMISYKNFDFTFLIQYKLGYYFRRPSINYTSLFLGTSLGHPDYAKRWQQPGDEMFTNVPSLTYPFDQNRDAFYHYSEQLVERADHIRLQDIQFGYTISKKKARKLPVQSITFNLYINNIGILWKATKTGWDPDYLQDNYSEPLTGALGLQVNF
jgi:TonB-linked SusC/RagA family outer membrane protein